MLLLHAKRHWPDYITTMMWPFALKEASYQLNWLSLCSDGHSCKATFFSIDKDFINISTLHVFGSPCFVLDSRLQSGIGGAPKWEPRSRLGIYAGHSPAHAGLVAMVLNPWAGHVSPQYHVVFDDLFSTVLFMQKSEVPPNWADLVKKSGEKVTDEHYDLAKTWLFLDPEPGDISMPKRNSNASTDPNLGPNSNISTLPTGIEPHPLSISLDRIFGLSQNDDYVPDPFLYPVSSTSASKNLASQLEDPLLVPRLINLETSGLRQSSRIAAINNGANHDSPAIAAYTVSTTQLPSQWITRPKPKLSFFSVFNSVGALWTFAPQNSHSNNEEHFSFAAQISHDFEQINGLFDNTINDFSHHIMAFTTSK
jgi:hypothetical protein